MPSPAAKPRAGLPSASIMGPTASGRWWSTWPTASEVASSRLRLSQRRGGHPARSQRPQPGAAESGRLHRGLLPLGGRGGEGGQAAAGLPAGARRRHRHRHDRLDADSRRPAGHAAGDARPSFATTWRRTPGCGRTTRASPRRPKSPTRPAATATATWPSAAASIAASGTGRRSCTAGGPRRRSSRPPTPGSNWPISCRPTSPATSIPTRFRAASAPPATRPCTTRNGADCPASGSCGELDPALVAVAEHYATPALPADQPAGGLTAELAAQGRPAAGRGRGRRRPSTPTRARSAPASSRARW